MYEGIIDRAVGAGESGGLGVTHRRAGVDHRRNHTTNQRGTAVYGHAHAVVTRIGGRGVVEGEYIGRGGVGSPAAGSRRVVFFPIIDHAAARVGRNTQGLGFARAHVAAVGDGGHGRGIGSGHGDRLRSGRTAIGIGHLEGVATGVGRRGVGNAGVLARAGVAVRPGPREGVGGRTAAHGAGKVEGHGAVGAGEVGRRERTDHGLVVHGQHVGRTGFGAPVGRHRHAVITGIRSR